MVKKLLLYMVMLFVLVSGVSAALDVSGDSSLTIADLATSVDVSLTLTNDAVDDITVTGFEIIGFELSQYTIPADKFSFDPATLTLVQDVSQDTTLTVDLTGTNAFAGTYTGQINVTTDDEAIFNEYDFSVVVSEAPSLTASDVSFSAVQGQSGEATLTLTNGGNTDIDATLTSPLTLTSTTDPSNTIDVTIADGSLTVDYGTDNTTTISVDVATDAPVETYTGTLNVGGDSPIDVEVSLTVVAESFSINVTDVLFNDVDWEETVTKTVTIENDGNSDLTGITLSSTIHAKYKLSFNVTEAFDLAAGETKDVVISVFVPKDQRIGTRSIGDVGVETDQDDFTFPLSMHVTEKLVISDFEVIVDKNIDGERKTDNDVKDGDKINEIARPGSKVEFEFKLRNQFDSGSDIEIKNIKIEIKSDDIGEDGIDVELDDEFDIEADEDSNRKTVEFFIPLIVEKETYDVEIHIEGEDKNDKTHEIDMIVKLEVDKKTHDVIIHEARLLSDTVECERKTSLIVELMNIGDTNEDRVKLDVKNSALGIDYSQTKIKIDEANDPDEIIELSIPIEVDDDVDEGNYPLTLKAYYRDTILDNSRIIDFNVEDCSVVQNTVDNTTVNSGDDDPDDDSLETTNTTTTTPTTTDDGEGIDLVLDGVPTDGDFDESVEGSVNLGYVFTLLFVNLIVIVGILGMVYRSLMKGPEL